MEPRPRRLRRDGIMVEGGHAGEALGMFHRAPALPRRLVLGSTGRRETAQTFGLISTAAGEHSGTLQSLLTK